MPNANNILCLTEHHEHKVHRQALSSFFSQSKVLQRQHMLMHHVNKLCHRIQELTDNKAEFNIGAALSAFTRDVSLEYLLNTKYNNLDELDFNEGLSSVLTRSGWLLRWSRYIPYLWVVLDKLPTKWMAHNTNGSMKSYYQYQQVSCGAMRSRESSMALILNNSKIMPY